LNGFDEVDTCYYSSDQIQKIRGTKIAIAGAGGIGSNCAHSLVRCGFEKLVIADFDTVAISNLNRQFYNFGHIGKPKVECLQAVLEKINPDIKIEQHICKIDRNNIHTLFGTCDIIVEAFDNPECKAMLVEEFIGSDKLVVTVSGIGGFGTADNLITRKVRDNFFIIGDGASEVNERVKPYAPSVMIAAAKQADIILSWVLK
jgi:sulfur carrier protein ThiS adenylyltransferase